MPLHWTMAGSIVEIEDSGFDGTGGQNIGARFGKRNRASKVNPSGGEDVLFLPECLIVAKGIDDCYSHPSSLWPSRWDSR
jgi:hypothetical protein